MISWKHHVLERDGAIYSTRPSWNLRDEDSCFLTRETRTWRCILYNVLWIIVHIELSAFLTYFVMLYMLGSAQWNSYCSIFSPSGIFELNFIKLLKQHQFLFTVKQCKWVWILVRTNFQIVANHTTHEIISQTAAATGNLAKKGDPGIKLGWDTFLPWSVIGLKSLWNT